MLNLIIRCNVVVQQKLSVTWCLSVLAAKKVKYTKEFVPLSAFATWWHEIKTELNNEHFIERKIIGASTIGKQYH